jgi:hypothetical protein
MTTAEAILMKSAAFFDGMCAASIAMAVRTLDAENADNETRADVLHGMRTKWAEQRSEYIEQIRAEFELATCDFEPKDIMAVRMLFQDEVTTHH